MKLTVMSLLALAGLAKAGAIPARRDEFSDQALSLHSTYRAQYGAGPLLWNNTLATGALGYAKKCQFSSDPTNRNGENLYAGAGTPATTIQKAVASWMDGASKYDYNKPGFSPSTGTFTQVVWKGTKTLGCATQQCTTGSPFGTFDGGRWTFIICRYSPPGNIEGQYPANVGRPQ